VIRWGRPTGRYDTPALTPALPARSRRMTTRLTGTRGWGEEMIRRATAREPAASRHVAEPMRDRLLRTAARLFAQRGYDRTSVQEIVDAAGVTKGALYHHFTSKEEVLYEIYRRVLLEQVRRLEQFANLDAPTEERLRGAALDLMRTTADNVEDLIVFSRSQHLLTGEPAAAMRKERRRYHDRFTGLVREGQRSGVFRTDVSAGVAVQTFLSALGNLHTWYRPDGELTLEQIGHQMVEMLLGGLRPVDLDR
jgi:AcrR family transcriptional regulator